MSKSKHTQKRPRQPERPIRAGATAAKRITPAVKAKLAEFAKAIEGVGPEFVRIMQAADVQWTRYGFTQPRTLEDWEQLAHTIELPLDMIRAGTYTPGEVRARVIGFVERKRAELAIVADRPRWSVPMTLAKLGELLGKIDGRTVRKRYAGALHELSRESYQIDINKVSPTYAKQLPPA